MRRAWLFWLLLPIGAQALTLGPLGPTYPVEEIDLLEVLTTHAREESENVRRRYEETQKRMQTWADRPRGTDLPTVVQERVWRLTPDLTDLTPLQGFERHWLFVNADDEKQVTFARRFMSGKTVATHRVILVKGSVAATQKSLGHRVWFDQNARLVKKLGIEALPALVQMTEKGILLKETQP